MPNRSRFPRLALILIILSGVFSPRVDVVEAKPLGAVATNVVISEFRTTGPGGGNDEFIEVFNPTTTTRSLFNLKLRKSSGCGNTLSDLYLFPAIDLLPGQRYLVVSQSYSGTNQDFRLPTDMGIADNGGIALTDNANDPIDQVGMCSATTYKEPDGSGVLSPMTASDGTNNRSYERKLNGCVDNNNNSTDFSLTNVSNPQNSSTPVTPCLYITNVSSSKSDGTYTSGEVIDIDVTFSNNVNVSGSPVLLLETGVTDRNAVYVPGSDGDNSITFRYTVASTDSSLRLDYVSTTALSLNGGSITGAVGDALLDLPAPGASGSLGDNNNIQIDAVGAPSIASIRRQNPTASLTNFDTLVFRVTFSEAVQNVDTGDFVVSGINVPPIAVTPVNGNTFDITSSDVSLAAFNGVVGLDIAPGVSIQDVASNPLPATPEPPIDETYTLDNVAPFVVSINQTASQPDPTSEQPVRFTIVFSEEITSTTFTASDITQNVVATATGVSWYLSATSDPKVYDLSATASGSGTLIPTIAANQFMDLAGNNNIAFNDANCALPEPNNCVTLNVTGNPTVTINQATGQADPTSETPINFTVTFSEPINTATFTTADITQNGTAQGVVWSITNSGDNMTFTLSATASGYGTLVPSIAANRVIDLTGNNNLPSTGTDNSVTFAALSARSVIINEVAWAGTTSSLPNDEWIELYNATNATINITGWTLRAADGTPSITLNGTIPAGGYFLLERDDDNTVSDIPADQIYTGDLSNSGEALTLRDGANQVIDTANGNGGAWPKGSSSTYETMERVGTASESDSSWVTNSSAKRNGKNANGGNILGTPKSSNSQIFTPTPTPVATPTSTPVPTRVVIDPRPIINEILARPGFDWNQDGKTDVFDEFIEIKNLTAIDISLSGWRLSILNGSSFSLPNVTLKPGERIVFYGKQSNLLLSDGGLTLRLVNSSGKIYDAFTYNLARAEDKSFCRLPDGTPGNSWFEDCVPTPNLTNTREGKSPTSPDNAQSPVCNLPDTIPLDFFIPECHGFGADIWNPFYWDQLSGIFKKWITDETSKWDSFIE